MVDGKPKYKGYCVDLIDELKGLMDFEYELYEPADKQYGTMNKSLEWNGMIKELITKVIIIN